MTERTRHELEGVIYREYSWASKVDGEVRETSIRICDPVAVYVGGSTHLVETGDGKITVVPAPGEHGCVLTYEKEPGVEKVLW